MELESDFDRLSSNLRLVVAELREHPLGRTFNDPIEESRYTGAIKYPMGGCGLWVWSVTHCCEQNVIVCV